MQDRDGGLEKDWRKPSKSCEESILDGSNCSGQGFKISISPFNLKFLYFFAARSEATLEKWTSSCFSIFWFSVISPFVCSVYWTLEKLHLCIVFYIYFFSCMCVCACTSVIVPQKDWVCPRVCARVYACFNWHLFFQFPLLQFVCSVFFFWVITVYFFFFFTQIKCCCFLFHQYHKNSIYKCNYFSVWSLCISIKTWRPFQTAKILCFM